MAPSSPRRKKPSSAAKRASTGPTALPGRNKRKTPPPLPEASGATQPPAKRKPALFQRTWSPGDEVRILEALATYRREHGGSLPTPAELFGALDGSLEKKGVGAMELAIKQRSFKRRYDRDAKKTAPPADEHERRLYLLSRHVWGRDPPPRPPVAEVARATQGKGAGAQASKDAAQAKSADHQSGKEAVKPKAKTLDEMRELYPYLVDEATVLVEPAVLESVLLGIENSDAQALDKKIRKARKQLAKAVTESARINNMEIPTVFIFTSSKLQPEKLRVENENNLLVDHLDKTDDVDSCTKQRLARVEREVVELRQAVIASQSQPKGIRCESAKSGLQSIVAENPTPANMLQKKIEAPNGLIHGKNVEVTSKYYCAVPQNVPPSKPKMQGMMLPPFNAFPGMPRKVVKKSPTPRRAARMKSMQTSAVFLCQATRLQLEKSRADKEDGLDICAQERLARVEREIVELKQIVIDSHYQATIESNPLRDNSSLKGVRCKSEESHPQLAVAENQIPRNILQKEIEVPNGFPHEKNEEVTSKCKHDGVVPRRIPRDNLKLQGLIKPPFNTFHGRTRKIDAESQTVPNMIQR